VAVIGAAWGEKEKLLGMVIANKSRVEKQKKFCTKQWFFSVNFRTVATKFYLKKLGIFF
jgi:hypothetical protein